MEHPPGRPAAGKVVRLEAVLLEDPFGKVTSQANGTARHVSPRLVEFAEP